MPNRPPASGPSSRYPVAPPSLRPLDPGFPDRISHVNRNPGAPARVQAPGGLETSTRGFASRQPNRPTAPAPILIPSSPPRPDNRGLPMSAPTDPPSSGSASRKRKRRDATPVKSEKKYDLFGSDSEDEKVINLTNADNVPQAMRDDPKPDNSVKLGDFTCVICMDGGTDLCVTYCGHLFCSKCLHDSLNVGNIKHICPICRQKIDNKPPNGKYSVVRSRGLWALELKLMTAKRSGKMPARS